MTLWLGKVPEYTDKFVLLFVVISALYACTGPVISGAFATGKLKRFLLIADGFYIFSIVALFISKKLFVSPVSFVFALVVIEIIIAGIRTYILSKISVFSMTDYLKKTILPASIIFIVSFLLMKLCNNYLSQDLTGLIVLLIISSMLILIMVYLIGLNKKEKMWINSKLRFLSNK